MLPVSFSDLLESEETLQREPSVFSVLHPSEGGYARSRSHTPQDPSHVSGTSASGDSFVQLRGDRDKIKGGAGTGHLDASDRHGV